MTAPAAPRRLEGPFPKRLHTPTIIQIEAVECGAVALSIILQFFGKFLSIEEARAACNVSRSGVSALKILKAARSFGLEAKGWKQDLVGLSKLPLPCIVFWNFSHFIVVEGFQENGVFINDPASGPRRVTLEEFDDAYTGVALTFAPGPDFVPGGEPPGLLRSLWQRLPARSFGTLAFLILAGLGLAFLGLISPAFQHVFVDEYLIQGLDTWVKPLLWIMFASALVVMTLQWLQSFILVRLSLQLAINMEGRFLWHLLHLPLSFYSQRFAGELTQRTTINDRVASLLSGKLARTVISLLTLIPYALLLFNYNWLMASVGILIAVLNLVAMRVIARVRTDANSKLLQDQGVLSGTAVAGFQNIESIKATASEDALFSRLAGCQAKVISGHQRLSAWGQVLSQGPTFLGHINTTAMLTIGGFAIMDGHLTIGYLLAFQGLMRAFTAPFAQLAGLGGDLQEAKGEITRLDDVLHAAPDPLVVENPLQDTASCPPLTGHLELRRVTFGYNREEKPLIDAFSLVVEPGQRVAFVGASGCGKSTLVMLIAGLLEPWSGEILFDGRPRAEWPREHLARALGYVSQKITFYEGTILENLTLFDASIPMERVLAATQDACIHETIGARSGGYLAPIYEGASNLSGGQSQRLEIARALSNDPMVLILDEATSALDPATEKEIDTNLRRRHLTMLIAAHRLSTVRDADEIIVLNHGVVEERGRHEELLAHRGLYYRLVNA